MPSDRLWVRDMAPPSAGRRKMYSFVLSFDGCTWAGADKSVRFCIKTAREDAMVAMQKVEGELACATVVQQMVD